MGIYTVIKRKTFNSISINLFIDECLPFIYVSEVGVVVKRIALELADFYLHVM